MTTRPTSSRPWRRRPLGALATGIFTSASLGGVGCVGEQSLGGQLWVQIRPRTTIVWTVIGSAILYKIVDLIVGLRVAVEAEREGLDPRLARRSGLPLLSSSQP